MAGPSEDGGGFIASEGHAREDITDYTTPSLADLTSEPIPSILALLQASIVPGDELSAEMDCQLEKIPAVSFGELEKVLPGGKPYNKILPIAIFKIGNLAILSLPVEVGTMAGRRLKNEIKGVLVDVDEVVINANSNVYDSYVVTREEYAAQQYEGGSSIFGPYTLNAIRQWTFDLAESFGADHSLPEYATGIQTFENGLEQSSRLNVLGNVAFDDKPIGKQFGDVHRQPGRSYSKGAVASAVFWGGHPNNNLAVKSPESYLVIERKGEGADTWEPIAYDLDPSTKYKWQRNAISYSLIKVEWQIPDDVDPGDYRIRHIGYRKSLLSVITRYEGVTDTFAIE